MIGISKNNNRLYNCHYVGKKRDEEKRASCQHASCSKIKSKICRKLGNFCLGWNALMDVIKMYKNRGMKTRKFAGTQRERLKKLLFVGLKRT